MFILSTQSLSVLHLFALFFLTGLIWMVQLVHYPSFRFVAQDDFAKFHFFHSQRITWIVAPMMLLELATGAWLWWQLGETFWAVNFATVSFTWLSTGVISVPIHNRLAPGREVVLIQRLVNTNWIRTVLWTARSLFWLGFILMETN